MANSKTHYQSDGGGITTVQPSTTAVNGVVTFPESGKLATEGHVNSLISTVTNTASKAPNGWFKDKKTGIIFQWGTGGAGGSGTPSTNTFPIAFPNQITSLVATHSGSDPNTNIACVPISLSQFQAHGAFPTNINIFYIAIGY